MAGLIPDGILSDCRKIVTSSTVASASIDRTGLTIPVRVNPDTDQVRLPGLAHFLPLRRWLLTFPHAAHADWAGTALERGDVATVAGEQYLTVMVEKDETYNVRVVGRTLQLAGTVTASTSRATTALDVGATGGYSTHIASLTLYQFIEGGTLLPVASDYMLDQFGVSPQQSQVCYAKAPAPVGSEPFAIQPEDKLLIGTAEYAVRGFEAWGSRLCAIYVSDPEIA